ncbi:MAG: hypothetical protein ACJAZO_004777 [Myxococcota bacterium]|jgi:hypothetical protein
MWQRILTWFNGLFSKRKPMSALEAIDAIQREKLPTADPAAWRRNVSLFKSSVFSEHDRKRLWRRERRNYDHASANWPPTTPNQQDQACLNDIIQALQR